MDEENATYRRDLQTSRMTQAAALSRGLWNHLLRPVIRLFAPVLSHRTFCACHQSTDFLRLSSVNGLFAPAISHQTSCACHQSSDLTRGIVPGWVSEKERVLQKEGIKVQYIEATAAHIVRSENQYKALRRVNST